jgi:hypothetical protein
MFGSGFGKEKCSDPDPGQNIPDPQHWSVRYLMQASMNYFVSRIRYRYVSVLGEIYRYLNYLQKQQEQGTGISRFNFESFFLCRIQDDKMFGS